MMSGMAWHPLEPADAGVFDTAPHVFRYEKHFAAPPERVWESLVSDASLQAWGSSVSSLTWLSSRPFGVGTDREVVLAPGLVKVHERYFRWDEGRGYSFYVFESNIPVFRRFAEDYALTPDGEGTRFVWTVAIEPRAALRLPFTVLAPVLKALFGRMASDGEKYFART
jgi:hypothetical protein